MNPKPTAPPDLFADAPEPDEPAPVKNCVRCHIRCRTVAKRNDAAQVFVKGTVQTGRFCTNCLVVDFYKNFELGPSSSLGKHYFDKSLPRPDWDSRGPDRRFDPEYLLQPHLRKQFESMLFAAQSHYGAELTSDQIDWDEVVANWDLPFPETPKRKGSK